MMMMVRRELIEVFWGCGFDCCFGGVEFWGLRRGDGGGSGVWNGCALLKSASSRMIEASAVTLKDVLSSDQSEKFILWQSQNAPYFFLLSRMKALDASFLVQSSSCLVT